MANSLRSFSREDIPAVLELSRRAFGRAEEQVGNPLWASLDELESELSDWDEPPEATLLVDEEEHGRRTVVGSVGPRNISGRLLLEHKGFHPRGPANAVFRLAPEEHKAVADGPEDVEVRRGEADDLEQALALYHATFPEGVFPDEAWRDGLARGSVYLAERAGEPLAFLNIDPSDRWAYQIGVIAQERSRGVGNLLLSSVLQAYWAEHPGEVIGLSVEADNLPALRLLRRQGFAPWLVLQSYELWL